MNTIVREPETTAGVTANAAPDNRAFVRFLATALLLPFVCFLLTLQFAASPLFLRISRRPLWHATAYRFGQPAHQDCDVVIVGDSTGMIDVDPRVIQARYGWSTCNLALPYNSSALAGTRLLDAYLSHNRAPRLIVFHLSPTHLRIPNFDEENGIIDGWLMVDESFPLTEKVRLFAEHPLDTFRFVTAVWKEFLTTTPILRPDWSGSSYQRDIQEQRRYNGWLPQRGTDPSVVCGWQRSWPLHTDPSYVRDLVTRYTRGQTRAILWTSPVRDCDAYVDQYQSAVLRLGLPPVRVYNHLLFFDAYHLNTEGAARNTSELVESVGLIH